MRMIFPLLIVCCVWWSCSGGSSTVDTGSSGGSALESTGTSADPFLESAAALDKDWNRYQTAYRDAFLYLSLVIEKPQEAIRKDLRSALVFAESVGSSFSTPEQLSGNFVGQKDQILQVINKDGDVTRSLTDLIRDLEPMRSSLTQIADRAKTLAAQGTSLADTLPGEIQDQAMLAMIQKRVSSATGRASEIRDKAPKLAQQAAVLMDLCTNVSTAIGF